MVIRALASVKGSRATASGQTGRERQVTLRLERFAWEAIDEQTAASGMPTEDFLAFAALYYLADINSGRIARRISRSRGRRMREHGGEGEHGRQER
jgi:hypothetical protein